MGVVPTFALVCGLDAVTNDLQLDERVRQKLIPEGEWFGDVLVPPLVVGDDQFDLVTGQWLGTLLFDKKRKHFSEIFLEGHPAAAGPAEHFPLIGYVVDSYTGSDLSFALMALFEESFEPSGFISYPLREIPEKDTITYRHIAQRQGGSDILDLAISEGRLIKYEQPWMTNHWFSVAIHILHLAGWTGATREMLQIVIAAYWS